MNPIGRLNFNTIVAFAPLHAGCLLLLWTPFKWSYLVLLAVTYGVRMFAITAGYHRYFSHRTFKLNRISQFLLAFLAQTSAQMGVLWWAAHHRTHHRYSDTDQDVHSPVRRNLWWSHMGWLLDARSRTYDSRIMQDFDRFPELRLLDKYHRVPAILFGAALFAVGGFPFSSGDSSFQPSSCGTARSRLIPWRMSGDPDVLKRETRVGTISSLP